MATETQAYLDEFKTPSIKTPAAANVAIKAFAPNVGEMAQQIALFSSLALEAEIAEPDDDLNQMIGSLRATMGNLTDRLRLLNDYNATVRSLWKTAAEMDADIRQYIIDEALGYTV